jgi:hypothetical protein
MKAILLTLIIFGSSHIFSQKDLRLNFFYGKNATNFIFKDGLTNKSTKYAFGEFYGLSLGIKVAPKQSFRPEINFYQAGAKSTFNETPLNWKLDYVGAGCAYLVKILGKDSANFAMSTGAFFSVDYLVKGNQAIGLTNYNIIREKSLQRYNITSAFLLNGTYKVTESLFLNFEYRFNFGLNNIEKDQNEKTRNIGNTGAIGISFKL